MSNPSTIWSQLSLPNSPIGSTPYVDIDGVSIVTDVLNYFYQSATAALPATAVGLLANQLTIKNGVRIRYTDISGIPGNGVAATIAGRAAFALGTLAVSITGAPVVVGDIIELNLESLDATLTRAIAVCTVAGTITITGNANATAIAKFSYFINKVYP